MKLSESFLKHDFYSIRSINIFRGIVMRRWRPMYADNKCDIELVLKGNHVLVTNEQRTSVLLTPELVSWMSNYILNISFYVSL